jgi:hypothetical protein
MSWRPTFLFFLHGGVLVQPARAGNLLEYLMQIPDPRGRQGRRFSLSAMLATVVCGILCGARGYEAIAGWIAAQEPKVWHWLGYWRKPPCANTFRDLLMTLDPLVLEKVVREWIEAISDQSTESLPLSAVAMDGKSLCGTLTAHTRTVHLLSLFDQQTGYVLSQMQVDDKTNEITAAPQLLETLVLKGRVVTADALLCQREISRKILDSGGHYLLVVKDNQPELKEALAAEFEAAFSPRCREAAAVRT